MPALSVVKAVDSPLSGPRSELRNASEQLAKASRELEEAVKPEQRLSSAIAQLAATEGELEMLRSTDASKLAAWLGNGGAGHRPEVSAETLDCERRLIGLRRDGDAARQALPAILERVQARAERVRALQSHRDRVLHSAAVEAAATFARDTWLPALIEGLRLSAPLESLKAELLSLGHRGADADPGALSAGQQVDEIIRSTRQQAGASPDLVAGARLLAALTDDPTATLGTTGP